MCLSKRFYLLGLLAVSPLSAQALLPVDAHLVLDTQYFVQPPQQIRLQLYEDASLQYPVETLELSANELLSISQRQHWGEQKEVSVNAKLEFSTERQADKHYWVAYEVDGERVGQPAALSVGDVSFSGIVESRNTGFKFPDGSLQATAGVTSESDPTVPANLKDGVSWGELSGIPSDIADGDQDTTYTAGAGLTLSGTAFSVQSCSNGQFLAADGSGWACASIATDWHLGGNSGTTPGTDFLGTTDNQVLELKVNNSRVLRLEPTTGLPNVIAGSSNNSASAGVEGASIGGGGLSIINPNMVTGNFGTVSGGTDNTAATKASVGGGILNSAKGASSTIAGGFGNQSFGIQATVGGGWGNDASAENSTIAGGLGNTANSYSATISGGIDNSAENDYAAISGGDHNVALGYANVIGGGQANIAGGEKSTSLREICFNAIDDNDNGVVDEAGCLNSSSELNPYASVGGGFGNKATEQGATVGGGMLNVASSNGTTISGGDSNQATSSYSVVAGGSDNIASGIASTVLGGSSNWAEGTYSIAAGNGAVARLPGQYAHASGFIDNNLNVVQASTYVLHNETTNGLPLALENGGIAFSGDPTSLVFAEGMTMTFSIQVVANTRDSASAASYKFEGFAKRYKDLLLGDRIFIDASKTVLHEDASAWDVNLVPNQVDKSMDIEVTGANSETIHWVATVRATESIFPPL